MTWTRKHIKESHTTCQKYKYFWQSNAKKNNNNKQLNKNKLKWKKNNNNKKESYLIHDQRHQQPILHLETNKRSFHILSSSFDHLQPLLLKIPQILFPNPTFLFYWERPSNRVRWYIWLHVEGDLLVGCGAITGDHFLHLGPNVQFRLLHLNCLETHHGASRLFSSENGIALWVDFLLWTLHYYQNACSNKLY